nr:MAG TPA: hypothetical protein [Caudoviricetes sp.]
MDKSLITYPLHYLLYSNVIYLSSVFVKFL